MNVKRPGGSDQMISHINNQILNSALSTDNTLHVVGVISNPARWHSRYRLFRKWCAEMLNTPNVKLYVVEGVYGDHQPECVPLSGQNYKYLKVKLGSEELWLKENLINIGVQQLLPSNWKYMCWCDTDILFRNNNWAHDTLKQLQVYNLIQPWSHGAAILSDGSARTPIDSSFGFLHATNQKFAWGRHLESQGYAFAHCGYSWACTRYWWNNIGSLIDFCLIGSADHHMCWGSINMAKDTVDGRMCKDYKDKLFEWSEKSYRACGGMIGYVPGVVEHGHHGPLKGRKYGDRWKILIDCNYNPKTDIIYDGQGVIHYIGPNKNKITKDLISYNRSRNEDSIES